jgi:hypothetical protein
MWEVEMCKGFGMIISSELLGYFSEPDLDGDCSHTDTLHRLKWKDNNDQFTRRFVRVQCRDWTMATFEFDEVDSLPGWAEENIEAIKALVEKVLAQAHPALAEYERVRDPAWAEYERVRDAAWAGMIAAMSKIPGYVGG